MVQLVGSSSLGLGKLIDGKNQFVHIRYSANADGSNMTVEIQADTKYIGIATNSSETAPTSPSDYSWGRFVGASGTSSYTWIRYSSNEDGSNMTTTTNEETKYIGVAITSENSAPTDHTKYSWALFKGEDGRGVKKTEVSYQKSTSGTVIPTGSWSASIPSVSDGEYLWTRTLFTYTDGTTTSTYNVSRNGTSGLGIARADVHYQKSTSGTTVPLGTWTVTIPTVEANEYLWTRTTITYTNYLTSVSYSVGKMGADGKDAQLLYLTATSEILAFDSDDKPKTTQPITISAKLQNASGTATFVAIPYIGNTAQTPIILGGMGNDRTLLPSQWTDPEWTIVAITATLESLTDTVSIHKLKDGQNGVDGADGVDGSPGVGVESATITYAASTSGTVHPTGGWSETIPSVPSGQYLWTRTVWLYTNGMSETSYSVSMMGERGPQGPKGDQGNDGVAGKDGVGVRSTVITYGLSSSDTTQPTSWSAQVPTLTKGKYLWTKTVWSYTDSTSETSYQKTYIARDGNDGTDGLPGKDGVGIRSTTITYAVSESGTTKPVGGWSTTVPAVPSGQYLWTRTVWTYTDDTSETGYSVAKMGERGPQGPQGLQGIQGPKGDQGIAGRPGADGLTSYTHIAYANSADGTKDFSVSDSNRIYIGVYVDFNATDSTSPGSYQWSLIKGADGADGAPGKPGADGRTPYFHTAYANSADGSSGFSTTDSNGKLYLGTCTDYTQADPTDYRAYTWVKIKGEQGPQGIQGPSGANGQSLYTWLKYADDANGSGMSENPDGKKYIGLAYNRPIPTESSNPKDYTWSLIQGENGVNGIDGKTYYTWVKYADTSTGGGLSDNPTGKKYIGLAYNKTTATESTNPADYAWSLIQGPQGPAGQNGKGVSSYSITYQAGTSGTAAPTGTWTTTIPSVPQGRYLWTKMVITYTDNTSSTSYSVSYIPANGATGATGNGVSSIITEFYLSTSKTTQTGGSWSTTQPTWSPGKYVWTRNKITYTNGSTAYTSPQCSSEWEAVNNIQVGGRNLWIISQTTGGIKETLPDNHITGQKECWRINNGGSVLFLIEPKFSKRMYGKTFTFSAWIKYENVVQGTNDWNVFNIFKHALQYKNSSSGATTNTDYLTLGFKTGTSDWEKVVYTHTYNRSGFDMLTNSLRFNIESAKSGTAWITGIKIEEGNKATDWTPAPEDQQAQIDGIQIGGQNLINLLEIRGYNGATIDTSNYVKRGEVVLTKDARNYSGLYFDFYNDAKPETYYVFSYDITALDSQPFNTIRGHMDTGFYTMKCCIDGVDIKQSYQDPYTFRDSSVRKHHVEVYVKAKDEMTDTRRIFIQPNHATGEHEKYKIENLKIVEGNKYTNGWSPAPEDTQDQIDQANENISNKVDQDAYDQDKSVIYDDINKKLDDEEFREFQKIMNELKGSYDSFVGEGGRYEQELKNSLEREQAIVKEFGDKVNQLNFINTYIRESEEGLVIGAKNSPMQMLLSKDSLSFMDGGQTVAYFSNQSFYINRGAVVESLQVGVHKLTKVGNEHTVIQYIPK